MPNQQSEEEKLARQKLKAEADKMKMEIAEELGLGDKVRERGWKSLTSKESGRIGGIMRKKRSESRS